MEMETAIDSQLKGRDPETVVELTLDNCKYTASGTKCLNSFKKLESLSMKSVSLNSLENFPSLPKLRKVNLGFFWIQLQVGIE